MAYRQLGVITALIEGVVTEIMAQSRVDNVLMPNGTTMLSEFLAEVLTSEQVVYKIDERIAEIAQVTPEILETIETIHTWFLEHPDEFAALLETVGEVNADVAANAQGIADINDALGAVPQLNSAAETIGNWLAYLKGRADAQGKIIYGAEIPTTENLRPQDLFIRLL